MDFAQRIHQFKVGVAGKLGNLQVSEVGLRNARPGDTIQLDAATDHRNLHRFRGCGMQHGQDYRRAGGATHPVDDLPFRHTLGRVAINRNDNVAGKNPSGFCRRTPHGRNNRKLLILHRNVRANAFEGTFQRVCLQFGDFWRKEGGMILIAQGIKHAFDGTIGHLLKINFVTINKVINDQIPGFPEYPKFWWILGGQGRLSQPARYIASGKG